VIETFSPIQALLVGAIGTAVVLVPTALVFRSRARDAATERRRTDASARRTREILGASPDGIFLWDHGTGGITCSSRLAEMLGLQAGTLARYDDIRACFGEQELQKLEHGVSLLRAKGTPFDVVLKRGEATLQAIGKRAMSSSDVAIADIVWIRDISFVAASVQTGPRNTSGLEDRHLTALLDTLPIPIWLRDADMNVAFSNSAAERVQGLDAALALKARDGGQPMRKAAEISDAGHARAVTITESPLNQSPEGRRAGTIGFAVDVDAADVRSTAASPAPSDMLRPLEVGVAVFAADTTLIAANAAFADLWRVDMDWLDSRPNMSDMINRLRELRRLPEVTDFAAFRRTELGYFGGLDRIVEDEMHLPDDRTIRRRIGPLDDGGVVITCEDLSGRLDLQRSLKSLDRVQRTTLENLHEGIAVFGGDGRLRLINPKMLKLWDLTEDALPTDARLPDVIETLGMKMSADSQAWPARKDAIASAMLSRTASGGKVELVNGQVLAFANIPLPDGASLVSYGDITDSHKVEEALRERARMLAETDRMKTEFIANVAMEVRTPLNTITGFADILRQEMFGELNGRQQEYAQGILETGQRMMGVVADIFDLASIEAGREELNKDTIDPHAVLVSAFNLVKERARQKNIRVDFDVAPDIGWITADSRRLTQVAFNLLTNAITYTPKLGHVTLSAKRDDTWLDIIVSDSGPGIPQADRARAFEPFSRLSGAHKKGVGGSDGAGLGLTIVKRFVALHGGAVQIKSNKARGTSVICRLPIDGENTSGLAPFDTDHAIVTDEAAE
tara:strand:- start:3017 stop:5395 length:2379 start_codon:yes stop_codon:yes gene_type:complete